MDRSTLSRTAAALVATLAIAACADDPTRPLQRAASRDVAGGLPEQGSEGTGVFHRYVAIGTSVSEGWHSDGVNAEFQQTSWPAQLARLARREIPLPLIASPGCGAPLAAPLASGLRIGGEPAAASFLSRACSSNEPDAALSDGNVAISGARTIHALTATPEYPDPNYAPLYARTLLPGMSQVTSMEARNPKVVSVELGANEVLGVRNGAVVAGQTVVPVQVWAPQYHEVVERVAAVAKHGVLVGLVDHAISLPSFRTGAELWAARATFAPLYVQVSEDCATAPGSENVMFVAVRVPVAAATGAARFRAGLSPAVLSCANAPAVDGNGIAIQDYVLSSAELAQADAQFAAMNAIVRAEAASHGFAYFALSALYEGAVTKAPFNAVTLMTSAQPYGPYISLDGLHPTAEGSRVLADAAARALNDTYRLGIPTSDALATLLARR
jgi:hypothetical protein